MTGPALDEQCPARELLDRVGDKWSTLLLLLLHRDGVQRHAQLRRALPDLSTKVLTQTLRSLERDGLVSREVRSVSPPHVEYALTELGSSLVAAMDGLTVWAFAHMDRVHAARDAYVEQPPAWLVPREPAGAA